MPTTPPPSPAAPGEARRFARDLAVAFLAGLFTLVFLFQPFKVEGTSMLPSLEDQERILVNKFIYDFQDISRGDMVVFRYPRDRRKTFIKRVVGVPGDMVEVRNGLLHLDGQPVAEAYLYAESRLPEQWGPVRVPSGQYFVLGDHRSVSNDSRDWGLVPRSLMYGKAVLRYWPPQHFGPLS